MVQSGDELITLVPTDAPLEIEASVPARDAGFVQSGDKAVIKFATFPYTTYGYATGTLETVSADSFSGSQNGPDRPGPRVRADLIDASEDSFEEILRTNLQGPYFLTQALARDMLARAGDDAAFRAAIVFVTSVSADMASPNRGEYCVSKAGLAMAARLFAVRLAGAGIPVYDVRPGIIATDMTAAVKDAYDRRIADGLVPEGRWGQPDDVGRSVAALLRGDVPYATGSVIHVDGGLSVPRL